MANYGNAIFLPEICHNSICSQSVFNESRNLHITDRQIIDVAKGKRYNFQITVHAVYECKLSVQLSTTFLSGIRIFCLCMSSSNLFKVLFSVHSNWSPRCHNLISSNFLFVFFSTFFSPVLFATAFHSVELILNCQDLSQLCLQSFGDHLALRLGATSASERLALIRRFEHRHLKHVRVLGKECRQAIKAYQRRHSRPLFAGTSTTELDCALNYQHFRKCSLVFLQFYCSHWCFDYFQTDLHFF